MKDYYETLGVNRQTIAEEIKKAFRRLAMLYHPDKNPDNRSHAEERFKEINQSYQVLGDSTSRWLYDRTGMDQIGGGINVGFSFRGLGCGRGMGRGGGAGDGHRIASAPGNLRGEALERIPSSMDPAR